MVVVSKTEEADDAGPGLKLKAKFPSLETIKSDREKAIKKRVAIGQEFKDKPPGRIGRNVHKRSKEIEIPEEFRKLVEAEQKLKRNDRERPIVYTKDGRPLHRPKTQEEQDRELAELMWRVNAFGRLQSQWADWEFKNYQKYTVFHDFCIGVSLKLIPVLTVLLVWDFIAVEFFEIPHLSTLDHPGFLVPWHFIAIPLGMYGFMMKVLQLEKHGMRAWALFCVIYHTSLFAFRVYIEVRYNGFRDDRKLRYEKYLSGVDDKPDDYDPDFDYGTVGEFAWLNEE